MQVVNNAVVTGTLRVVGAIRTETAYITNINITNLDTAYIRATKQIIVNPGSVPNFDEGLRLNSGLASGYNAYSGGIFLGNVKNNTVGTMDGMWTIIRNPSGNLEMWNNTTATNTAGFTLYRDGSAPSWKGTRISLSNHGHSYLPLAGGTMTGNIAMNAYGSTRYPLKVYGGDANGQGISVGDGGVTIVGAGESAKAFESLVSATSENLYLTADQYIAFFTNCNTIGNRVGVYLDVNRWFYPDTNNTGYIGVSTNHWSGAYINTVYGNLSGNASTATKLQTARTISITGSVTGSANFDGSGNITISTATNHGHSYLPLSGGTITGNINFSNNNTGLTWNRETDGASILFSAETDSTDNYLVFHVTDDENVNFKWTKNVAGSVFTLGTWKREGIRLSSGTFIGSLSGNASTATTATQANKLTTARNIAITGAVTGNANFDGSGNIAISTSVNHSHSYLPLSGGVMTGELKFNKNTYFMRAYNGDGDRAVLFYHDASHFYLMFTDPSSASSASYNGLRPFYVQKDNGYVRMSHGAWIGGTLSTGAISCSGNITCSTLNGTAERANMINGVYTGNGGQQPPSYIPSGKVRFNMMNTSINGDSSYKDWLLMDTYTGDDVPYVTAFGISKAAAPKAFIMVGSKNGSSWQYSAELISTNNIGSYAPSKTGGGASGTWGINITGNAGGNASSATVLQTTRSIFGQNFNGSQNVAGQVLCYGWYTGTANSRYAAGGIQIRENGLVSNGQSDIGYAPTLGFHWANRCAGTLVMNSVAEFCFYAQGGGFANVRGNIFVGSFQGNASTASSAAKLTTARTITLAGSVTGSANFDGSGNITITTATNHGHSYLPLSGGTMTGNISFNMYATTRTPFYVWGGNADGQAIGVCGGGATIIGSGESAQNIQSALSATSEILSLCSDVSIDLYTQCQTIANRKKLTVNMGLIYIQNPDSAETSWGAATNGCVTIEGRSNSAQTSFLVGKVGGSRAYSIELLNSNSNNTMRIYAGSTYISINTGTGTSSNMPISAPNITATTTLGGNSLNVTNYAYARDYYFNDTRYNEVYSNKTCDRLYFINTSSPYLEFNRPTGGGQYGITVWKSDARLKDNIKASTASALDVVNQMRHFNFTWKETGDYNDNGYVAQELEKVNEDFVIKIAQREILYEEDGMPSKEYGPIIDYSYQVNETTIIPYLSKAIQEEDSKVEALTARVQELEEETQLLRKQVDLLRQQNAGM